MPRTNETKNIKWQKTCKCQCRLDAIVCNDKKRWNKGQCRCECKQLIDKGICDKGYILNPSNCECECGKSCDLAKYLDYKNCTCKKMLVDKLVEQCNETTDQEEEIIRNNENICNSFIVYVVFFSTIFTINIGIGAYFAYYKYVNRNYVYQKMIY